MDDKAKEKAVHLLDYLIKKFKEKIENKANNLPIMFYRDEVLATARAYKFINLISDEEFDSYLEQVTEF